MQELMIICKIIKPKVLISKVNALLQLTTQVAEQSKLIELGDLVIDKDNFKVTKTVNISYPEKRI